ncbi:MAG: hypothetical protein ACRD4B_02100, partial [Acidobacteriota bacterium]
MLSTAIQFGVVIVAVALAVLAIAFTRNRLIPKSIVLATFVFIPVFVFLGLVAYTSMGGSSEHNLVVSLLLVFIGTLTIQPDRWSAANLCRSLAIISGLIAIW